MASAARAAPTPSAAPAARWQIGQMNVRPLDAQRLHLYMSLRNLGAPSAEPVVLVVEPLPVQQPKSPAVADISQRTNGQRSALVEIDFVLPPPLVGAPGFRLFVIVGRTVTDMVPVVGGVPRLSDPERGRYQPR
jgi:hypothetical protein